MPLSMLAVLIFCFNFIFICNYMFCSMDGWLDPAFGLAQNL